MKIEEIILGEIDKIIFFYQRNPQYVEYSDENEIFLPIEFIIEYDRWRYKRGYTPILSLGKMAEIISGILSKEIIVRIYWSQNNNKCMRGVLFPIKEIMQTVGLSESDLYINKEYLSVIGRRIEELKKK